MKEVDDDTVDEADGDSFFGNIPPYAYYSGAGVVLVGVAICLCSKKKDGYTEIAP